MPDVPEVAPADLPLSLRRLWPALRTFVPPTESFSPAGQWEHTYAVRAVFPSGPAEIDALTGPGVLRLRKKPTGADTFTLQVGLAPMVGGNSERVEALITCAADRLSTPLRWELHSLMLDAQGAPIATTDLREKGELLGAEVRRTRARTRVTPIRLPLSANWCVMEALQRWPAEDTSEADFDMLEELQLLRPGQRLAYRRTLEVPLAAGPLRLHGYEQFGQGLLPYTYWLDDQRRLLFAIGGLRSYLWQPSLKMTEVSL